MAPNKGQTKRQEDTPLPPKNDPKSGYWWLFGEEAPDQADKEYRREVKERQQEEARRRREGYEWFFS